jgi:trigger factor
MKTSFKKGAASTVALEVILDPAEFDNFVKAVYENALANVHLKGFRPGTAPEELARGAVNQEKVFEEAANQAVRETLSRITDEKEFVIVDKPRVEILEAHPLLPGSAARTTGVGLAYKADLVVFPEVTLPDYRDISKKVLRERRAVEVRDEEIEKSLDWLRQSRAKITRVSRASAMSDLVEVDIESAADGKPLEGGSLKGDKFILGDSKFVPGFDGHIVGMSEGERRAFSLTAPKDYWQKDLQGKQIDFNVTIKGVFAREVPPLDEEFARAMGPNFKTVEEVKASIKDGLTIEREAKENERIRAKIIEEIAQKATIDPPHIMVERTLDGLLAEVKHMFGDKVPDGTSDEELRKNLSEKATMRLRANLVLHKISQAEHLEPTKEEIEAEGKLQNLDPEAYNDYIYGIVRSRKVFEFLERSARAEEKS